jgi:signal peptidase II
MADNKFYIISIISILIVLLDQLSKYLVRVYINNPVTVIKDILDIIYTSNTGAGFSILQGNNITLIIITLIILGGFLYYYRRFPEDKKVTIPVGLILGGAIGNLIDRIFFGHVIDFIDFKIWPVFNIADSAITVGAFILIVYIIRKK